MAKQRKKLLIVDGYNVLRSGSRYRNAPDELDALFMYLISHGKGLEIMPAGGRSRERRAAPPAR